MREILKAASQTGGAALFSMLFSVITIKVLALLLGPHGTGLYTVLMQLYTTAVALATLGGGSAVVQGIASREGEARSRYIATTIRIFLAGAAIAMIIIVAFAPKIAQSMLQRGDPDAASLVRWLALPVLFGAASIYLASVMNGFRLIGRLSTIKIIGAFSTAALAYPVALMVKRGHFYGFILLLSAPLIVQAALSLYSASREGWLQSLSHRANRAFSHDAAKHFLSIAVTMLIAGQVGNIVSLAVNSMVVQKEGLGGAGIFNAAWSLSMQYVMLILTSFSTYFLPTLSQAHDETGRNSLLANVSRLTTIVMIPMITAMVVFKPFIIGTLYSSAYIGSLDILRWMLLGDYIKISSWVIAMPVLAYADMKTFFWTETIWYLAFLGLTVISLRFFGSVEGIGMAFGFLYVVYLIYYLIYIHRRYKFRVPAHTGKIWLAGFGVIVMASIQCWYLKRVVPFSLVWICLAMVVSWFGLVASEKTKILSKLRLTSGGNS